MTTQQSRTGTGTRNLRTERIPSAPARKLIQRHARIHGSLSEVGRLISQRFGYREEKSDRSIHRILADDYITFALADNLCTALGTHIGLEWGWGVYNYGESL